MKKTISFHIGTHKTGTTSIQKVLSANRDLLAEHGFLYPGKEIAHHEMAGEFKKFSLQQIMNNQNGATRACFDEIAKSDLQNIIISSEVFEVLGPSVDKLKEFLDNKYTVKIIFYTRRQDEKIEALYNASVKNPTLRSTALFRDFISNAEDRPLGQLSLAECIEEFGDLDYFSLLMPWSQAFGTENILVRCYEDEQLSDGLFSDFFSAVGLNTDARFVLPKGRINKSLHWDLIEIIRQSNIRYQDDSRFHIFLLNHLTRLNQGYKEEKPRLLSPRERREIIERYGRSNECVAREFLGRNDGRLFFAPVPVGSESWEPYQGPSPEKLTEIFLKLMHSILDNQRKSS